MWCFVFSPDEEERDTKIISKDEKGMLLVFFFLFLNVQMTWKKKCYEVKANLAL